MKTWPEKIRTPSHGVCTVKEASVEEVREARLEIGGIRVVSVKEEGLVNVLHNGKLVAYCSPEYAKARIIK